MRSKQQFPIGSFLSPRNELRLDSARELAIVTLTLSLSISMDLYAARLQQAESHLLLASRAQDSLVFHHAPLLFAILEQVRFSAERVPA